MVNKMRKEEGLRLNKTDIWANGKMRKKYDLGRSSYSDNLEGHTINHISVYSDDDEQEDLLVNLVTKMRNEKSKPRGKRKHSGRDYHDDSDDDDHDRRRKNKRSKKKRKAKISSKDAVLSKVDKILELKESGKSKKYSEEKMMRKVDKILFSDISSSVSQKDKVQVRNKFLAEVDDVLGLRKNSEESSVEESESDCDSDEESEYEEEDDDDLNEDEMRLLNLINANKIDVKVNFPSVYPDTDCHFCRKTETSEHLARCPVYEGIMTGSEFKDIRSEDTRIVKSGLANIRSALLKRSEALSVTRLGSISAANMKLLTLGTETKPERKKTKEELIDEILATT